MIKKNIGRATSSISINKVLEGETLETKVRRILTNKEPIKDGAPIIYLERKDGVLPQYNVRTDRMEIALEAQDSIKRNLYAKRDEAAKAAAEAENIQGTEQSEQTA